MRTQDSYSTTLSRKFGKDIIASGSDDVAVRDVNAHDRVPSEKEKEEDLIVEQKKEKEEEEENVEFDEGPVINYVKMEILHKMMVPFISLSSFFSLSLSFSAARPPSRGLFEKKPPKHPSRRSGLGTWT
jgi:hypothetical protein